MVFVIYNYKFNSIMIDKFTRDIIEKSIIKDWDKGEVIYLDYKKLTDTEINDLELAHFNVTNIPYKSFDKHIGNYYCTFFSSDKSSTGWVGMFVNKNKTMYYTQKHINRHNYSFGYV